MGPFPPSRRAILSLSFALLVLASVLLLLHPVVLLVVAVVVFPEVTLLELEFFGLLPLLITSYSYFLYFII